MCRQGELTVGKLSLVDRDRHAHDANSPAGDDAADKHHTKMHRSSLKDGADDADHSAELDGAATAETIYREPTAQCTKERTARERRDNSPNRRRPCRRVEVRQEIPRRDHVRHHTRIIPKQERLCTHARGPFS